MLIIDVLCLEMSFCLQLPVLTELEMLHFSKKVIKMNTDFVSEKLRWSPLSYLKMYVFLTIWDCSQAVWECHYGAGSTGLRWHLCKLYKDMWWVLQGDVCVGDEGRLVKGLRKGRGGFV